MFKRTCLAVASAATLFAAGSAQAGWVNTQVVTINPVGRQAYGALYATRNSPDTNASIGCAVQTEGSHSLAFCEASSALGGDKPVSCQTTDPEMIQTVRSLGPFDILTFLWDSSGKCTYLNVNHSSSGH